MPAPVSPQGILALVITEPDSPYIERTLVSLLTQSAPPTRVVLGVRGDSAPLASFLESIHAPALEMCDVCAASSFFDAAALCCEGEEEWIWMLHADSAPEVHALEALIDYAGESEDIGIVGSKQVDWDNPRLLLEVGIRATRSARRVPEIHEGELDQGQYDERFDVLGVGSAGMLASRRALEAAGGLGESSGPFGDGLELSRRVRAAGYSVVVCPYAKVRHARASLGADERSSFQARRVAQIRNSLLAMPRACVPLAMCGYALLAFLRAIGRLAQKEVAMAGGEIAAAFAVLASPGRLRAARARYRRASIRRSASRRYEDRGYTVRAAQREGRIVSREAVRLADVPDPLAIQAAERRRHRLRIGAGLSLAFAIILGLAGQLPRLMAGQLMGGALLPDSLSAREVFAHAGTAWLASGDGYPAPMDALWAFLAPLALPLGSLGVAATAVILAAMALAALIAFACAGEFASSPALRAAAALTWAFAPPLLDAVNAGHVAGVVAHICAPALLMALARAWRGLPAALGAASFLFALEAACAPVVALAACVIGLVGVARRAGGRWRWLWLPVPALALLAPTLCALPSFYEPWRLLFATPGDVVATHASALSLLAFSPLGQAHIQGLISLDVDALARLLPAAILFALAIMALLRPRNWRLIRGGWLLLAAGWAWAMLSSFVAVGADAQPGGIELVSGWPGIGLSAAYLGLWIVLLSGGDGLLTAMNNPATKTGALVLASLGLGAPIVLGMHWAADSLIGSASMLQAAPSQAPAVALAEEESAAHTRVLALYPDEGGVRAEIWRGDGFELHEASMLRSLARVEAARGEGSWINGDESLAWALVNSADMASVLGEHAVGIVLVPGDGERAPARELIGELNSTPGLEFVTANETGSFWRVRTGGDGAASIVRLTLIDSEGNAAPLESEVFSAHVDIPSPGIIRLAERADSRWHATLDGTELEAHGSAWNQQWEAPASGRLEVYYGSALDRALPWVQVGAFAVAAFLAIPVRRRHEHE